MPKRILFLMLSLSLFLLTACGYTPAASDAQVFSFSEVTHIFALTEDAIFDRYGEPDEEVQTTYYGMPAHEFRYAENRFRTEAASGYAYYVLLAEEDPALPAPREITLGMALDDVLPLFASSGDETFYETADGAAYRLLYGDYTTGYDYGVLFYEGSRPVLLEYASEGCIFSMGISHQKVHYFEYLVS